MIFRKLNEYKNYVDLYNYKPQSVCITNTSCLFSYP